jgi:hypothetical protein
MGVSPSHVINLSSFPPAREALSVVFDVHQCLLLLFWFDFFKDWQSKLAVTLLLFPREIFYLDLLQFSLLHPIVIGPHGFVVVGLLVDRTGTTYAYRSFKEITFVVVVNGCRSILSFVELNESKASELF